MRALVVEDEVKVAQFLELTLGEWGYSVDHARDGEEGVRMALVNDYDVMICDVKMPNKNGLELVAEIRRQGRTTPVLILTSQDSVEDLVRGFDAGGDDYLTKPFRVEELHARLRALVRRGGAKRQDGLTFGPLHLNRLTRKARAGDEKLELSSREFDLLEYFMLRPDEVVRRSELLQNVWGMSFHPGTNVIDVHMSNLRGKLRRAGHKGYLQTIRNVGFALRRPEAPDG